MKRVWLIVDANFLHQDLGLPPPQRARNAPVGAFNPGGPVELQFARVQQRDAPRRNPEEGHNPIRDIKCTVASSLSEAEEVAQIAMERQSNLNLIIFEAVSLIEAVPVKPICKKWNENGEIVI